MLRGLRFGFSDSGFAGSSEELFAGSFEMLGAVPNTWLLVKCWRIVIKALRLSPPMFGPGAVHIGGVT